MSSDPLLRGPIDPQAIFVIRWVAVAGDIEDPSMYRDPSSGNLHMVMHTEDGGGAGGSAHSSDEGPYDPSPLYSIEYGCV